MVYDVKTLKIKSVLTVGANVFVVRKQRKPSSVIEKINQSKAIVNMKGRSYIMFLSQCWRSNENVRSNL